MKNKKSKTKIPIRLPVAPPSKKHKDPTKYDRKKGKVIPTESLSIKEYFLETKHAKDQASKREVKVSERYIEQFQHQLDIISSQIVKAGLIPSNFFQPELTYIYQLDDGGSFVVKVPNRGNTPYPTLRVMTTLAPGMTPRGDFELLKPVLKRVQQELAKRRSFR
jgi:hypothetical protein